MTVGSETSKLEKGDEFEGANWHVREPQLANHLITA